MEKFISLNGIILKIYVIHKQIDVRLLRLGYMNSDTDDLISSELIRNDGASNAADSDGRGYVSDTGTQTLCENERVLRAMSEAAMAFD
jgi:hypothetical protein